MNDRSTVNEESNEGTRSSESVKPAADEPTTDFERLAADNESLRAENETLRDRLDELEATVAEIASTDGESGQLNRIAEPNRIAEADGGQVFRVVGELDDEAGIGVLGRNTADSGVTHGVLGEVDSEDDGTAGVSGHATASNVEAETSGVEGISDADADNSSSTERIPAGVEGTATGENTTHGVRGTAGSVNGRGVAGFATSESYNHSSFTGSAIGVIGVTDRSGADSGISDSGGVFGYATADSGTAYGVIGRTNSPDGWGVRGMDMSGDGYGVYSYGDSRTDGDHEITGDTEFGGELSFPDETPQRTAGPIAKGWINSDGSIENAVNVENAYWNESEERYRINITNETYWFDSYVTVVTPLSHATARTTSNGGDLVVEFRDLDDELVKRGFQFVTFDLPSGTETTANASGQSLDRSEAGPDATSGASTSR